MRVSIRRALPIATSLLLLPLSPRAFGGTVNKVSAKKGTVTVDLTDGEKADKDAQICFYDDETKVGCGKVTKSDDSSATVKIDKKKLGKKVKEGMTTKVEAAAADGDTEAKAKDGDGDEDKDKDTDKKAKVKKDKGDDEAKADDDSDGKKKKKKKKKLPLRIYGVSTPMYAAPSKYNKVTWLAPKAGTTGQSVWTVEQPKSSYVLGKDRFLAVDLSVAIPLGQKALIPGVRYRIFAPSSVDADYQDGQTNPYVTTEQNSSALGFYFDYQFMRINVGKSSGLNLQTGLDIDMSTETVTSKLKSDVDTTVSSTVATATSKDTIVSLRFGTNFDLSLFGPVGGVVGFTFMLPLTVMSKSFSATISDPVANQSATPSADLEKALGHGKNSLAYELVFGGVLSF